MLAVVLLLTGSRSDAPAVHAQAVTPTPELVDYDIDDDGYIDVRTRAQWYAIDSDLNSDGAIDAGRETRDLNGGPHNNYPGGRHGTAFPNQMPTMGCGERDHDGMSATPHQPTCVGYELFNDITFPTSPQLWAYVPVIGWDRDQWGTGPGFSGRIKGNGYKVINPTLRQTGFGNRGIISQLHTNGTIYGLGVWAPNFEGRQWIGGITGFARDNSAIIASFVYAQNSNFRQDSNGAGGGIAGIVNGGTISNSFVRGTGLTWAAVADAGGLAGGWPRCARR